MAALKDPLSWAPAILVFVVYLTLYKTLSLGEMNNLAYIDPLSRPGAYLGHLVVHLPVMWLATVTPVFPSLLFLYWNGREFEPLDLASLAPGASLELADTSDIWAGML